MIGCSPPQKSPPIRKSGQTIPPLVPSVRTVYITLGFVTLRGDENLRSDDEILIVN